MTDEIQGSQSEGNVETAEARLSPEALLETLSAQTTEVALFPGSMREEWFFSYDVLMEQAAISRFIQKMNVCKVVSLPHYRLVWPFYYPPQGTALPSLERTNQSEDEVWGLIFSCRGKDFRDLERFLRVPNRYHRSAIQVQDRGGRRFPAFTYVLSRQDDVPSKPSAEYISKLIEVARERELPEAWLDQLAQVEVTG
ncbi:gamma-glutamylcyclotransferase [bacterium]|nr:gamma-glutamylcyclotransferase [bacterium]